MIGEPFFKLMSCIEQRMEGRELGSRKGGDRERGERKEDEGGMSSEMKKGGKRIGR